MRYAPDITEARDKRRTVSAVPARCLRCSADLTTLPEFGRYCPQCGLDTHQSPPRALLARAAESVERIDWTPQWAHLRQLVAPGNLPLHEARVIHEPTSLMLVGYSNAMYKLGRRYETGLGAARNPGEADRCYFKAARLGNFWAVARLAVRYFGGHHPSDRMPLH